MEVASKSEDEKREEKKRGGGKGDRLKGYDLLANGVLSYNIIRKKMVMQPVMNMSKAVVINLTSMNTEAEKEKSEQSDRR